MTNDIIRSEELQMTIKYVRMLIQENQQMQERLALACQENKQTGQRLELVYKGLLELVEPKESRIFSN